MELQYLPMTRSARDALIAGACLWVLFAITVGFRVFGRIKGMGLGADDILSMAALLLSSSTIGLSAAVFTTGVGYDLDPNAEEFPILMNNLPFIMQMTFVFTLIYIWCLAALKMSQIALYARVFALQLRAMIYGVAVVVVLWAIIFNFVFIFLCDPIAQQWSLSRTGHCMDQILLLKCLIMTNLVTDLFIVVLPIRSVWQLQMRKTEKIAVLACFGLGFACCIISLARFIQIYTIDLLGNLTGTSLITFMLCTVELMLAGLCINIPMLRPFYVRLRARYKTGHSSQDPRSETKLSRGDNLNRTQSRLGKSMAWIELADKDRTVTVTHDDASSERKLTFEQPDDGILVHKDWVISRV